MFIMLTKIIDVESFIGFQCLHAFGIYQEIIETYFSGAGLSRAKNLNVLLQVKHIAKLYRSKLFLRTLYLNWFLDVVVFVKKSPLFALLSFFALFPLSSKCSVLCAYCKLYQATGKNSYRGSGSCENFSIKQISFSLKFGL